MIRQTTQRLGVLAAIGLIGAPAIAQVTTPPPKADAGEAYTPPPKQAAQAAPSARSPRDRTVGTAPTPRHRPLAELGEDGFIRPLKRLPDEVALVRNPYIGPSKSKVINDLRIERQARMERQIIENIDLLMDLETGIIDQIRLADIEGMQQVARTIQPLIADPSLTHELKQRGALTRIQAEGNNNIVRQYQIAVNDELKERYPDDNLDYFMRFIMNESIKEARLAYQLMLNEGASKINELRGQSLSPNAASAIAGVTDAASLREALKSLSFEEHQGVLRAIIAMRENPTIPPVVPIDFGEGKTDQTMTESVRTIRPDGGVEIKPGAIIKDGDEEEAPSGG